MKKEFVNAFTKITDIIPFGKHEGNTFASILETNPDYLVWLSENSYNQGLKEYCNEITAEYRNTKAAEKQNKFDALNTKNLQEIYILSPTFNKSKNFEEKLKIISKSNRNNIRLHTEMRSDEINKKTARLLYRAGFRSLEIGLQTLNKDSLLKIGIID